LNILNYASSIIKKEMKVTFMPLGKMNPIRNPGRRPHRFPPIQGQGQMPPAGLINGLGGLGIDRSRAHGLLGNSGWRTPQPQQPQQFIPQFLPPAQAFPSQKVPVQESQAQSYLSQQYVPQGYNQGYGGQIPVQPAWKKPRQGGIKGFISNFIAKWKR
jgi:hypothetical protein